MKNSFVALLVVCAVLILVLPAAADLTLLPATGEICQSFTTAFPGPEVCDPNAEVGLVLPKTFTLTGATPTVCNDVGGTEYCFEDNLKELDANYVEVTDIISVTFEDGGVTIRFEANRAGVTVTRDISTRPNGRGFENPVSVPSAVEITSFAAREGSLLASLFSRLEALLAR